MSMIPALTMGLLAFVSVILIFIVLLQRGRGGGLAGALGGAGGASAFGTKAGDVFTRITIVLAVIWVLLGAINVVLLRNMTSDRFGGGAQAGAQATLTAPNNGGEAGDDKPAPGTGSALSSENAAKPDGAPAESKPADTKASEAAPATDPKPAEGTEPAKEAVTPEAPKAEAKPEAPQPEVKPETPKEEAKQPE